jgi:hypothetical protein
LSLVIDPPERGDAVGGIKVPFAFAIPVNGETSPSASAGSRNFAFPGRDLVLPEPECRGIKDVT